MIPCVDHLPARVSARRSARASRSTTGAMRTRSDEPLPAAIQDAVAAAIEDGATMDEIVAWVRAHDDEGSPLIPRARRCARARPAEGCWAERMDGLIGLQRETDRFAEEWERTRDPGAEGLGALIAIETLRTLALRTMAELGAARGAGGDRGPRPPRAGAPPHRKRGQAPHRARAGGSRCRRRARRSGRTRGPHDPCRTGRDRPPGHGGAPLPWVHRPAAGGIRVGRRLCRGLSRHPAEVGARSACRRPCRAFTCHPAGAGARFACRRRGAGRWRCAGCMRRARFMGRAQGAGCRPETAGGGRPTLADRPSLLPCGMERARVRPGDSASAAARHALPAPRSRHVERQKRHPHLTPALSAPQGRRGRVGGAAASPLRPRGRGTGGGGRVVCATLSRVRDPICRAHDPAGVRDAVPGNPTYPTYPT